MAADLRDPVLNAFSVQLDAVAYGWSGHLDKCIDEVRACLDSHGHWLELNEYCQLAATAEMIATARGHCSDSWDWISRAIERLRRSGLEKMEFAQYLFDRARAVMAAMGRTVHDDRWLVERFEAAARAKPKSLYHRLVTWGPRLRVLVESGEVGSEFEHLIIDFARDGHKPRFANPILSDYYSAVVHGRIHQCLRAPAEERARILPALRRAVSDLAASGRAPLFKAHRLLGDAHVAWFEGDNAKARAALVEAAALAEDQSCTWVLYGVARARAHMLREEGKLDSARDQARVAEALALAHGAEPRARFIREELDLARPVRTVRETLASTRASASQRARKQLTSFLNIVGTPQPGIEAVDHATSILENLLIDLEGEEAVLSFRAGTPNRVVLGRNRHGFSWAGIEERHRAVFEHVRGTETSSSLASVEVGLDTPRVLVVPLFLYDENVGTLYLERAPEDPPFSPDERELFELVSHQVPIALELVRLIGERARLEASLQHAKKMEALGELAGGVAHDFNNMLMIVRGALDVIGTFERVPHEVQSELEVVGHAADRAANLTKQLLGFSRHKPAVLEHVDVKNVLSTIEPILRRVAGKKVDLVVHLETVFEVQTDRAALEQALVNLVLNARDAMPDGGTVTISMREVTIDEAAARTTAKRAGDYVVVEVADTGVGMDSEVASRVFDPFFTTKRKTGGTGLGLTMVYAFTKNSGGHVTVASDAGAGTSFRMFLPKAPARSELPPPRPRSVPKLPRDEHAILIVDDDRSVRDSLRRVLHRAGYRVFAAGGAPDALDIVRRCAAEISLVVLDVMMPGMSGPELAKEIAALELPAPILFISGYAPGDLPVGVGEVMAESLLQKPFGGDELLQRVAQLVEA